MYNSVFFADQMQKMKTVFSDVIYIFILKDIFWLPVVRAHL